MILGYAAARPELAQETLERTLHEFHRLADGIEADELHRLKIGMKSSLIMGQESAVARSARLAADWQILGRIRPLEEIRQAIDDLTIDGLLDFLRRHPLRGFQVVTLGPQPLRVPEDA